MNKFLSCKQFVVAGASKDTSKFGYRVLKWYKDHQLPVVPMHPKEADILDLKTIKSLKDLQVTDFSQVAVSVVTPPAVTLSILQEASNIGIENIWCQPGATDNVCHEWIKKQSGLNILYDGPCILRDARL